MGIEAIGDEMPFAGSAVAVNHLPDMGNIICLGTGVADHWSKNFPSHDIKAGNQGLGAVANILKLSALHQAWAHRQVGCFALDCLDTRHLISAYRAFPRLCSFYRTQIDLSNVAHFRVKVWIFRGGLTSIDSGGV